MYNVYNVFNMYNVYNVFNMYNMYNVFNMTTCLFWPLLYRPSQLIQEHSIPVYYTLPDELLEDGGNVGDLAVSLVAHVLLQGERFAVGHALNLVHHGLDACRGARDT